MLEFFEKHWMFLILAAVVGSFVIYSVNKDRKGVKKWQDKDTQKKTEENQKDAKGGLKK